MADETNGTEQEQDGSGGQGQGRVAAVHGDGTGEEEQGRGMSAGGLPTAGVEQGARGVQVGVQAEVEVGFAFGGHGGGQVEHRVPALREQRGDAGHQVAGQGLHARVALERLVARGEQVGQHQAFDAAARKLAALQQFAREARAQEAGAAGDEDVHAVAFVACCSRQRRSQPRPVLVPARGRYSQPTKPA